MSTLYEMRKAHQRMRLAYYLKTFLYGLSIMAGSILFIFFMWAVMWGLCALDDVCYCENTGDVAVCQSLR